MHYSTLYKCSKVCYTEIGKGGDTVKNKKYVFLILGVVLSAIIFFAVSLMTDLFIFDVLSHASVRLLSVLIIIPVLKRCFGKQWKHNTNKALISCAVVMILDLVIIDAVRYILSNGISTILFLPVALPICFMIIMLFLSKDNRSESRERIVNLLVGIPLLLLSVFIEIYSFFNI